MNRSDLASKEQYPGKNKNHSTTFTVTLPELLPVPHHLVSPRASALFPTEDLAHLITKFDSILAGSF
ncbi:hypothetical protein L3X38_028093 [Prunus dulcis]|uniref:Uncharacterized protein n=1 Tax=Prunus dulcis TaxID=3755 RepID=A0AAD4VRE4_PRUDU|nr:hypothetical protein L3X38_028093 [Prunus dulcis]